MAAMHSRSGDRVCFISNGRHRLVLYKSCGLVVVLKLAWLVSALIDVTVELVPDGKEEVCCIDAGKCLDGFRQAVAEQGYSLVSVFAGETAYQVKSFGRKFPNHKFDGPTRVRGRRSSEGQFALERGYVRFALALSRSPRDAAKAIYGPACSKESHISILLLGVQNKFVLFVAFGGFERGPIEGHFFDLMVLLAAVCYLVSDC